MPPQSNEQSGQKYPEQQGSVRGYGFLLILTFLLVITGIFGVWYFSHPLPEDEPEYLVAKDEFAGWKTYRNEKYGFEFKYPPVLKTTNEKMQNTIVDLDFFNQSSGQIYIKFIPTKLVKEKIEDIYGIINPSEIYEITVGDRLGYKFNFGEISCGGDQVRVVNDNQSHFKIQFNDCDNQELFVSKYKDRILSTFKFIPASTPATKGTGQFCGGIAAMKCPAGYVCKLDGTYPDAGGKCEISPSPAKPGAVCIQVIATAKNDATGEIHDFPTPCDVPAGWTPVN